MTSLAKFYFKLSQLYPGTGKYHLNTCGNPDCSNFGHAMTSRSSRCAEWSKAHPNSSSAAAKIFASHGYGAYKLAGADVKHRRISQAFEYEDDPHVWSDQRTIKCLGQTRDGKVCNAGFSILSPTHLDEEVDRLRNQNGVLDGPACGVCGVRVLEKPDEFSLDGIHERSKDRNGKRIKGKKTPTSLRVVHAPCRGQKGARFSISLPHAGQKSTSDNLRILGALLNSAGIVDVQRMVGTASTGKKIGMSRIYDRIEWLEQVFLAYEREMLRRWKNKVEKDTTSVEHRLSHDDLVLTVNWETASDRRNTQLNCAITADARSGFVYRMDVDFDTRATPLDQFNATYLDEDGMPANLRQEYSGGSVQSAPKFSWQRPTGRLHEPQFFAACVNEIRAFQVRAKRRMPRRRPEHREIREDVLKRTNYMIDTICTISQDWFGFPIDRSDERGSFKGMTTKDIYTKAAHFVLLKEMLPRGHIILTTEQESTLPNILPNIFDEEIREDRFAWLAMSFNKKAKKPERLQKVADYRKERQQFQNEGFFDGRFTPGCDVRMVTEAFIAERMRNAVSSNGAPFQISNYTSAQFPRLWVRSPSQSSGEIDKVVGFPVLPRYLRNRIKALPVDQQDLSDELREELAPWVYKATLQPASTFMNSLRERLSVAKRADGGGARIGGTYIPGAIFNPKTLVSLLNIFRVHYNFFELRPYACPYEEIDDLIDPQPLTQRSLRVPGTDEYVELTPKARRTPSKRTPAMRHGMDAFIKRKDGTIDPPDIYRVLYRPWLYMGTKFGARFERSRSTTKPRANAA